MTRVIEAVQDFKELAQFLAEMNTQKSFHIGYCGEKVEEIFNTLTEDFTGENGQSTFHVARNGKGEIEVAIGLDIDGVSAEVWGPYNKNSTLDAQAKMWESLVKVYPAIETFYFFLNKENQKQQEFMKAIQAVKTGKHFILEAVQRNFKAVQYKKSRRFIQRDYQAFKTLHEAAFPNTYYNARTIVNRLNDECILKILKSISDEMLGYAYYEVDLEMEEATLHYFAISPIAQNQGYGTELLKEVITEIFSYSQISEIRLCVESENTRANHVYLKAGFEEKQVLYSYRLNTRGF